MHFILHNYTRAKNGRVTAVLMKMNAVLMIAYRSIIFTQNNVDTAAGPHACSIPNFTEPVQVSSYKIRRHGKQQNANWHNLSLS